MGFLSNILGKKEQREPVKNYEEFWNWFKHHEKSFFDNVNGKGNIEKAFFDRLSPSLNDLKEGISFLCGMYDDHTAELIFSAETVVKNIAFVEELVNSAPAISGWKFTALKPAVPIDELGISMDSFSFDSSNMSFYSNVLEAYPDEIDITVVHSDFSKENADVITHGSLIFIENFIGELNFSGSIDNINVVGKDQAKQPLVPIGKLSDFLIWREKEFVEKYEGTRMNTENDSYSVMEAEVKGGLPLIAVVNTGLLNWELKASHPWILVVEISYDGTSTNGLPDNETSQLLNDIEDKIMLDLKDADGYLNIGRETADNKREIYFACKEFRFPSKIAHKLVMEYDGQITIDYDIYKDKYWQSFNRYTQ